jgi:polyphosphate kinase
MYFNRELSWLKFNERVLGEVKNETLPLFERIKFSAIFSDNLDEFFMIRVASIQEQIKANYEKQDDSEYTPNEIFSKIHDTVNTLQIRQQSLTETCMNQLEDQGINLIRKKNYDEKLIRKMETYFDEMLFPVLTPMAVDFSRPFPFVRNKYIYVVCKLMIDNEHKLALVQVPSNLKRIVKFKVHHEPVYVLLEELIIQFIDRLFVGHMIIDTSLFRITRNADLYLKEDAADDLLMVIEEAVKNRQRGEAVRLEVSKNCDLWILEKLKLIYKLKNNQVYLINGLIDMTFWFEFLDKAEQLKSYKPRKMPYMSARNIFKVIAEKDIFIHHPFETFNYIVEFIKTASKDSNVLAIKQTLYRVSGESEIIKALGDAAENGKQVTVLVELMARFDEEKNIEWAKELEKKGVHVIYGIYGFKTHSKITLVVRKEMKRIKRYVHISTGNYNDKTAAFYTDMGYLTCRENFGVDASLFFNMIFGFSNAIETQYLKVSPYQLRKSFYQLIDGEIKYGSKGCIIAKMNSLVDKGIIDKLYEASNAGVKIQLIVRGICTLVPGRSNLSENITVKSIIGEFLEHSRIYYFKHAKPSKIYLSSADWMTRNLDRRVELMFPILEDDISTRIELILSLYLKDNTQSWHLRSNGDYEKNKSVKRSISAQKILKTLEYIDDESFIQSLKSVLE